MANDVQQRMSCRQAHEFREIGGSLGHPP
jgi:hypothetical protein